MNNVVPLLARQFRTPQYHYLLIQRSMPAPVGTDVVIRLALEIVAATADNPDADMALRQEAAEAIEGVLGSSRHDVSGRREVR